MAARTCFAALTTAAFLVAGCGGGGDNSTDSTSASSTMMETVTTTTETRTATCVHQPAKPFGLVKTSLRETDEGLAVAWRTNQPMPTPDTVLFVIYATDETGEKVFRQLGVKYLDGEQIAYYVFDFDEANQINLDGQVPIIGNEVRAVFPWSEVNVLGDSFRWHATLNVAGDDIDFCPDRADGAVFPKPLTFPAS